MDRFLKRKLSDNENVDGDGGTSRRDGMENLDGGTSRRDDSENLDRGTSRRDANAANTNYTTHRSSRISRHEVNFDELPYDPADRRRISDYIGEKLQNEIRRKYLITGPFRPPPGFNYPQKIIAGHHVGLELNGTQNMIGLSIVRRWINASVYIAIYSGIAMRAKVGMMHLQKMVGMALTNWIGCKIM